MYDLLHSLLSDKKGGARFTLFSAWHFFYIALTVITIAFVLCLCKNKDDGLGKKAARFFGDISFCLYVADFFFMPLAYGKIDIEKLPFHACTAMCVMCFLSYRIRFLEKFRTSFVLLGLISNLVYLVYPAGVMWLSVHPLSYRVIQTLMFHSIMTVYGFLTLIFESEKIDIKKCYRDLTVTVCMTLWALAGNYAYNNESVFYNWFFVVRDPFYAIPENIAPYIMPFLNIALFFTVEMIIQLIITAVKQLKGRNTI